MRSDHKDGYIDGKTLLVDIEDYRDEMGKKTEYMVDTYYIFSTLGLIIERQLKRKIYQQQDLADDILSPTEKQRLEQERDKYKQERNQAQDWFCYYQDKCHSLESPDLAEQLSGVKID